MSKFFHFYALCSAIHISRNIYFYVIREFGMWEQQKKKKKEKHLAATAVKPKINV